LTFFTLLRVAARAYAGVWRWVSGVDACLLRRGSPRAHRGLVFFGRGAGQAWRLGCCAGISRCLAPAAAFPLIRRKGTALAAAVSYFFVPEWQARGTVSTPHCARHHGAFDDLRRRHRAPYLTTCPGTRVPSAGYRGTSPAPATLLAPAALSPGAGWCLTSMNMILCRVACVPPLSRRVGDALPHTNILQIQFFVTQREHTTPRAVCASRRVRRTCATADGRRWRGRMPAGMGGVALRNDAATTRCVQERISRAATRCSSASCNAGRDTALPYWRCYVLPYGAHRHFCHSALYTLPYLSLLRHCRRLLRLPRTRTRLFAARCYNKAHCLPSTYLAGGGQRRRWADAAARLICRRRLRAFSASSSSFHRALAKPAYYRDPPPVLKRTLHAQGASHGARTALAARRQRVFSTSLRRSGLCGRTRANFVSRFLPCATSRGLLSSGSDGGYNAAFRRTASCTFPGARRRGATIAVIACLALFARRPLCHTAAWPHFTARALAGRAFVR